MDYLSGDRLSFPSRPSAPSAPPGPAPARPGGVAAGIGKQPATPPASPQKPGPVHAPLPELNKAPLPAATPAGERPEILAKMAAEVAACRRCPLAMTRNKTVFGVGSPMTRVVFVGEGPGADEDRQGEPFVGAAGTLLDGMLRAVGLDRSRAYIANVVKCRPPGNRTPHNDEMAFCQSYLFRQLEIIRPEVIFAMGVTAARCLLGHTGPIGKARGRIYSWRGIPVIASYHPAYYLRSPGRKYAAWEDLLILLELLEKTAGKRPEPP